MRQDDFWVKGQPYSLADMLAGDPAVEHFVGVVFQAFLSAFNYHRWHSPVSGTILNARTIEGTYFSEAESEGEDPIGPNNSQAYLAHVAARDPAIGQMVVMPIGMGEISSCVIDQRIKAGARGARGSNSATSSMAARRSAASSPLAPLMPSRSTRSQSTSIPIRRCCASMPCSRERQTDRHHRRARQNLAGALAPRSEANKNAVLRIIDFGELVRLLLS